MIENPIVVLNVVGLASSHIGENTPNLQKLAQKGSLHRLETITPAVTCSVQSSIVTGTLPSEHGCVGNGWYFRDLAQVWLWRQSNHLVQGEKIWETARHKNPDFRCAKMFWWYNMYSSVDYSATPRPIYAADGRKLPDVYTEPYSLRDELTERFGTFPLFNFWGPMSNIKSSRWIAEASRYVFDQHRPHLTLIYLPHLDYPLQKLGPQHPQIAEELRSIDSVCGELIDHFQSEGAKIMVHSEYAIHPVSEPVPINRLLREEGWIRFREELGLEVFDAGASDAFAVADHQIAHVYVKSPQLIERVKHCLEQHPGIDIVLDASTKAAWGLDHPRSGELIALAKPESWFTYYYWLDDSRAPDFARTVDIHNKPGFDPVELFIDPNLKAPKLQLLWKLAKKKMGFRTLMDVIPLDATLVKGSHGRVFNDPQYQPVLISSDANWIAQDSIAVTEMKEVLLVRY